MRSSERRPSGVFRRVLRSARRLIGDFGRDMRQGVRVLRRRSGLAAAGVLAMAMGIGASVTVFSFVDAILFPTTRRATQRPSRSDRPRPRT